MTTDQEIKDRLFSLWAEKKYPDTSEYWQKYNIELIREDYSWKTISEIKALMQKDGIDLSEINKIIGV